MGYPMTFDRLVKRNHLDAGSYDDAAAWGARVNVDNPGLLSEDEFRRVQFPFLAQRVVEYETAAKRLLGDLRRLEHDAVDEQATCAAVAARTGLSPDDVAAVIREFLRW